MPEDSLSPKERALRARIAIHTRWANTPDRTAATATARNKFMKRFEDEVDPEGRLDPAERAVRAGHARKAYFAQLALKSAQARRASKRTSDGGDATKAA